MINEVKERYGKTRQRDANELTCCWSKECGQSAARKTPTAKPLTEHCGHLSLSPPSLPTFLSASLPLSRTRAEAVVLSKRPFKSVLSLEFFFISKINYLVAPLVILENDFHPVASNRMIYSWQGDTDKSFLSFDRLRIF